MEGVVEQAEEDEGPSQLAGEDREVAA